VLRNGYISVLLSALVVQCPFQCFVGDCFANGLAESSCCFSECCGSQSQQPTDDSQKPNPNAPDDCPCGDCFCRGALPIDEISDGQVIAELVSFMTCWVKLETSRQAGPTTQVRPPSFVLPTHSSGHDMRSALSSWLL